MTKHITPELVAETVRFCATVLRRQAEEIERVAAGAEGSDEAWSELYNCLLAPPIFHLAQDAMPAVGNGRPDVIEETLGGFGPEADRLREMLVALAAPQSSAGG